MSIPVEFEYVLKLSSDDLWSLVIAIERSLKQYEVEPPHFGISDAHPNSAIGRMVAIKAALENAAHGRRSDNCKVQRKMTEADARALYARRLKGTQK